MKTAGVRPQTAMPDGGLQKVNLYDLVFRMPQTDLHNKRDDRFALVGYSVAWPARCAPLTRPGLWVPRCRRAAQGRRQADSSMRTRHLQVM